MEVKENLELRREILEKLLMKREREGWHVTDLIVCPRKTYFRKRGCYEDGSEKRALLYSRGRAHHDLLEISQFREIEIEKDGIRGTIDMLKERPVEIFTTTLPPSTRPEEFVLKIRQLMAYCYITGMTEGDLVVFHISGTPELKVWTLKFSEEELRENWERLLRNKKIIEEALMRLKEPEERGEVFECKECGFRYLCYVNEKEVKKYVSLLEIFNRYFGQ